jgi:chemotaxis protein methyltransferase CheR
MMAAEAQSGAETAVVAGAARDAAYLQIRDLVYQTSGIYHSEDKLYLLAGACKRRMPRVNAADAQSYFALLNGTGTQTAEMRDLLNEITIGETCFFRSQAQLNALQTVILPELMELRGKAGIRRVRIWSAGCSTGEEPYTLAMFLMEECEKEGNAWTFEIAATDLNDRSLETAKAGVYGEHALRNTPEHFRNKYFKAVSGDKLQAKEEVKKKITFSRLNLSHDGGMKLMKRMDLIFCCNVLIYFDEASKSKVVKHFYANLQSGGHLFLGHVETLYRVSEQFRLVHLPGATAYRKP